MTEPRFDMCAAPPPEADWAYEVDDTDVTCGPGWWPLHRHGQPDVVRLAPNTRYWTWRNEYVLLGPGQGATVTARLTRDLARRGLGGLVVDTHVRLDLRARTAAVDPDCPGEVREPAQTKADRLPGRGPGRACRAAPPHRPDHRARPVDRQERHRRKGGTVRRVLPPPHVGELRWPVLSAVRVGNLDQPAEFVVIVDCGRPAPREQYAVLRLLVWPSHVKDDLGEYDLTFAQARRRMAERAGLPPPVTVEVVVVRDPDAANDYTVFVDGQHRRDQNTDRVRVVIHDIDPGAAGVSQAWVAAGLRRANELSQAAAAYARDVVIGYADGHDGAVP